jgi:cilia- and flagella-associated protein 57
MQALPMMNVTPKFMFGLKSDVKNGIHYLDDQRILYVCGHNVVIYSFEDKSQIFIPGTEGSEGISALSLSKSKRFLAVCEKSERAFCSIYDIHGFTSTSKDPNGAKRKKILTS